MRQSIKTFPKIVFLSFFPIYFTTSGLYRFSPGITSRLVLPATVIGSFLALMSMIKYYSLHPAKIKRKKVILFSILFLITITISVFSLIITKSITIPINTLQLYSGFLGIVLGLYFKKEGIKRERIFKIISRMFFIVIVSNFILQAVEFGFLSIFLGRINAKTIFGDIHQSLVYYPYIISMVFLYDLPRSYEKDSKIIFILIYGLVSLYIFLLQVRGAVVSFILGICFFVIFGDLKRKHRNRFLIGSAIIFLLLYLIVPKEVLLGRFVNRSGTIISGREQIWLGLYNQLDNNPIGLIFGNMEGFFQTDINVGMVFKGASFHNQYLEFLGIYGLFGSFIIYIFIYEFYFKKINNKFFLSLFFLHILVDMNVNVPLRVTNPAIYYHFYWYVSSFRFDDSYKFLTGGLYDQSDECLWDKTRSNQNVPACKGTRI